MLEGRDYRSLNRVFLVVAAFLNRSMECEKTVSMTRVHPYYSEIFVNVMGNMGQRACGEDGLSNLECMVEKFKKNVGRLN